MRGVDKRRARVASLVDIQCAAHPGSQRSAGPPVGSDELAHLSLVVPLHRQLEAQELLPDCCEPPKHWTDAEEGIAALTSRGEQLEGGEVEQNVDQELVGQAGDVTGLLLLLLLSPS